MKLSELREGQGKINTDEVECISLGETRDVTIKQSGSEAQVREVQIKDDEGTEFPLTLWNEMIEQVDVGTRLKIENGYTNSFRNVVRLNIARDGKLIILD